MNKESLQKILDMAGDDEFRDLVQGAADTLDKANRLADSAKNPAEAQPRAKELLEGCGEELKEKAKKDARDGIALILTGGGGKGCYQVGVYRALTRSGPFPRGLYTEVADAETGGTAAGSVRQAAVYDDALQSLMAKYDIGDVPVQEETKKAGSPIESLMAKYDAIDLSAEIFGNAAQAPEAENPAGADACTEVPAGSDEYMEVPAGADACTETPSGSAAEPSDADAPVVSLVREPLLPDGAVRAFAGTSIGALNAAMFAGGSVEEAEGVWRGIVQEELFDMRDLYAPDEENDRYLEGLLRDSHVTDRIGPDAPLTTVTVFDRQTGYPKDILLNTLSSGQQIDYLMASAAFPVVFTGKTIDGHDLMDGGVPVFGSNMPVAPMYHLGFRRFLVVHTESAAEGAGAALLKKWNAELNKEKYFNGSIFVHLYPSRDMGRMLGTMKFTQDYIEDRMELGFTDAEAAAEDLKALLGDLPDELSEIHIRGGRRYRSYEELLEDLG